MFRNITLRIPALMNFRWLIIVFLICLLSCHNSKTSSKVRQAQNSTMIQEGAISKPIVPPSSVSPGHALIEAQVLHVLQTPPAYAKSYPCNSDPCFATVKILRIVQLGAGFDDNIITEAPVVVYFMHSLSPTKKLKQGSNLQLAGLVVGDIFTADVEGMREISTDMTTNNSPTLMAYYYIKK